MKSGNPRMLYCSFVQMFDVTARSIMEKISGILEENEVPWKNLVSILMDSCNVMRGRFKCIG